MIDSRPFAVTWVQGGLTQSYRCVGEEEARRCAAFHIMRPESSQVWIREIGVDENVVELTSARVAHR